MLVCLSAWNIYRLDAKLPVLVNLQHSFIESTVCLLFFFFFVHVILTVFITSQP